MSSTESNERIRLEALLKDKKCIAIEDNSFVSRWEARRAPYYLSIEALRAFDDVVIKGKKQGTQGIFYPAKNIRRAAREVDWVPNEMIPETRITKQMKASDYDLTELRKYGVYGHKKGARGKAHYFYTQETLERELAIEVIPSHWKEGEDYIAMTRYPTFRTEVPMKFAIHSTGMFRAGAFYYWGEEATSFVRSGSDEPGRPKRIQQKEVVPEDGSASDEELPPGLKKLDKEIASLEKKLAEKKYKRKQFEKTPIYTDSDSD